MDEESKKSYVLKEAELLVSNYVSKFEDEKRKNEIEKYKTKCKKLKVYARLSTLALAVSVVINIF